MTTFVGWCEPWAGAAPCALLVASAHAPRLVPWPGCRHEHRRALLALAGLRPGAGGRVRLGARADWAGAWKTLREPERAREVAAIVRSWGPRLDARWAELAQAPYGSAIARTAQFLSLQACSGHARALWHSADLGWRTGDPEAPGRSRPLALRADVGESSRASMGLVRAETLARRLERLANVLEGVELEVVKGAASRCSPAGDLAGWVIFLDPCASGRASRTPRTIAQRLGRLARRLVERRARVIVRASVPLVGHGWTPVQLDAGTWASCSFEPVRRPPAQWTIGGTPAPMERRSRRSTSVCSSPVPSPARSGEQLALFSWAEE